MWPFILRDLNLLHLNYHALCKSSLISPVVVEKNKNVKHFWTQTDGETDGKRQRKRRTDKQTDRHRTDRPHDHKGSSELSIQVS